MLAVGMRDALGSYGNHLDAYNQRKKIEHYSYGLADKVGKGYSSTVYHGRNDSTSQIVAIKVIDMKGVKDEVGKEMLDCEIEALKTLNHPNILKCWDVFTTLNNCYIITEYCNEGDLAALLSKRKRLSETDTLGYLKDICQGFFQIADNNYLHRDLKLANIFLRNGVAKIADFGFAKKNKTPGQKQKYNVGSPLYMSPEALKRNVYSVKNDIWSIGVITYELLHGETPWECKTEKELIDKMVRVPVNFQTKVSEDLKDFIKRCLEVDENKRFDLHQMKNHPLVTRICKEKESVLSVINKPPQSQIPHCHFPQPSKQVQKLEKKASNKENVEVDRSSFSCNNQFVVQYINFFRLLYKIAENLKQFYPQEKSLSQILSNEVLNRITSLKNLSENPNKLTSQEAGMDLKNVEKYFNEITNPSIKKYLTVIGQYFQKYSKALSSTSDSKCPSLNTRLKAFLRQNSSSESNIMVFHWVVEYLCVPAGVTKDELEAIIEPKQKPTLQSVEAKIKRILEA